MSMLKLKEILWEITPECNKNCSYCGSKDLQGKKPLGDKDLKKIAKQLADYGVEEVTLTGGEPGVLAEKKPALFNGIVRILRKAGVKVKAVTNGKLVLVDGVEKTLGDLDVIGFSINTPDDVFDESVFDRSKHTMITNFGKHNIWDFDELAECARVFRCWQIQLTMGENLLNPNGIKHLRSKIADCDVPDDNTIIVLADNLQVCHDCEAGISSCSITYDGGVVACLSERSYGGIQKVYGNLLKESIDDIWENEFKDIRFKGCRKCCRDFVEYPGVDLKDLEENEEERKALPPTIIIKKIKEWPKVSPDPYDQPRVVLYGAFGGNVQAYAVTNPPWTGDNINPVINDGGDDYGVVGP